MEKKQSPDSQVKRFRKAARNLGSDESEATFDTALGKIAKHKPKPDAQKGPETKKPQPRG